MSDYSKNLNLLKKLADTNKDRTLNSNELNKMYKMCDVADKPRGYILTSKDLKIGIGSYMNLNENNHSNFKKKTKDNLNNRCNHCHSSASKYHFYPPGGLDLDKDFIIDGPDYYNGYEY